MKFVKSIAATCMLLFAFTAGNARADFACDLYVSYSYYNYGQPFAPGQSFGYNIDIRQHIFPGPQAPNPDYNHFTIEFYGSGIGYDPAVPGESYPGVYPLGFHYLGGFYNPGGIAGTYERFAVVRWPNGGTYCTTNTVTVVLL